MTCAIYFHCINPRATHSLIFKTPRERVSLGARYTSRTAFYLSSPFCVCVCASFSYSEAVVGTLQIKSRLTIIFSSPMPPIYRLSLSLLRAGSKSMYLFMCVRTYIYTRFTFYMEVTKYAHKLLYHFLNRGKILSLVYTLPLHVISLLINSTVAISLSLLLFLAALLEY